MTRLSALKDKDPKDVARLLSTVSTSLLPNPGIGDVIEQTGTDPEFVKSVLAEIRDLLRVQPDDLSRATQSQIYAFLSDEISKATLVDVDMDALKNRLGMKGELHPSQFEVRFGIDFETIEDLGIRKNYVIDAINHPDRLQHFPMNRQVQKVDAPITLSIKFIESKKRGDRFALLVISARQGKVQVAVGAYRIYFSDVDLSESNEPLEFLKAFVNTYGLRFRFGDYRGNLVLDELVEFSSEFNPNDLQYAPYPIEGQAGSFYCPMFIGAETAYRSLSNTRYHRVGIALVLDVPKYAAALRKHNAQITPEDQWRFPRIGEF